MFKRIGPANSQLLLSAMLYDEIVVRPAERMTYIFIVNLRQSIFLLGYTPLTTFFENSFSLSVVFILLQKLIEERTYVNQAQYKYTTAEKNE